jgi:hypothetical protein
MQKSIQIHPCLLKLSRKQESVTDGMGSYMEIFEARILGKILVFG